MTEHGGGQPRNSVSINTADAIIGKIDRFREILAGKRHTISLFSIPATKPRFNIYGWNVRRSGWFKMSDVEIAPRRFSDPAKVMSFFTFYVPVVFFTWMRKYRNVPSRWMSMRQFIPPFRRRGKKIFLFVYSRWFDSFDNNGRTDYRRNILVNIIFTYPFLKKSC